MFFFGSKKVLGLDIGTSTIKIAEVDVSRTGATLNSFAMIATPPQAAAGGDIQDPGAVAQAIASLYQELKTKRKAVAAALWGSSIVVKKISMPRIEEKLVNDQIKWEAEQYSPFDINEVNLAFKVLNGLPQNPETMDILLIIARHEQVYKYSEIIGTSGLQCPILDVGGLALANCFEMNYGIQQGQTIALLNVGASVTNIVIIDSGEVVFCRDVPVGGLSYTGEIQKALSISPEDAESHKLSACTGQATPEEVPNIIRATTEVFGDEIQGAFDFYINNSVNASIKKIYLTGGSSRVPGLIEHLGRALNIPCEPFNPLANIKVNPKNITTEYLNEVKDFLAVVVGLGLRTQGDA